MKSKLFTIDLKDLLRGALLAVLTTIATALIHIIELGDIMLLFEWSSLKVVLLTGLSAGVLYLLKNFLTNEFDKPLKS